MQHQLDIIFTDLEIPQYLEVFLEHGFDTWETILDITESDLDALGVKLGHRRKLQRRIANSRGIAPDVALTSPMLARRMSGEERPEAALRPQETRLAEVKDSGLTKRKYRRHPKPDENAPERPPSAYVLFSNRMREDLRGRSLTFTEIAKLVGENWQSLPPSEKEPYETQAQQAKDKYHADLTEYKKTAGYRRYQEYLHEFKLKHSSGLPQDKESQKRPRLESSRQSPVATISGSSPQLEEACRADGRGHRDDVAANSIHRTAPSQQEAASVATTPLSFHVSLDDPIISPGAEGHNNFKPIDRHSSKMLHHEMHHDHRPPRSTSWRLTESGQHRSTHLPSLSDVLDKRQPSIGQRSLEDTGYMRFMQSHHHSGPVLTTKSSPPVESRRPLPNMLPKSEHSSTGSMPSETRSDSRSCSCSRSGSGSAPVSSSTSITRCSSHSSSTSVSAASNRGMPPSSSSYAPPPSETSSLPLPIHALLASDTPSRFEPSAAPVSHLGGPITPSASRSVFPRHNGLEYMNSGTGTQSPQQSLAFSSPSRDETRRNGGGRTDERPEQNNIKSKNRNGMDGMSALLRAGEIVDHRIH